MDLLHGYIKHTTLPHRRSEGIDSANLAGLVKNSLYFPEKRAMVSDLVDVFCPELTIVRTRFRIKPSTRTCLLLAALSSESMELPGFLRPKLGSSSQISIYLFIGYIFELDITDFILMRLWSVFDVLRLLTRFHYNIYFPKPGDDAYPEGFSEDVERNRSGRETKLLDTGDLTRSKLLGDGTDEKVRVDRTVILTCSHKFCFDCLVWTGSVLSSNGYTKYRPYPTPAQFAASQEIVSKATTFLRRELPVWDGLDVEFFTTFMISPMKSIDVRSESALKLLAELLNIDTSGRVMAEHCAHEVSPYVRSAFKDLFVYDSVVQYDTPPHASSPSTPRPQR
ncbi:uncharacterized protein ARMOST_15167 [Armillaria ostoyae]|uniref:Uncharacterized protein n=1 Tax=Armillaria ostoyae TaxID=47428 RepID=A0A284RSN5_ARMOS|nr:uncharacterized protein ARMOST_15167 [Armillaria ostoyae]